MRDNFGSLNTINEKRDYHKSPFHIEMTRGNCYGWIRLRRNTDEILVSLNTFQAGNYMFQANNRNSRTRCEICSKLTKTPGTLF